MKMKELKKASVPAAVTFEEIYEENYARIYNYLYGTLLHRQKTEDLTSEVFFEALRSFSRFDIAKGSPRAWLTGIARHRLLDSFRRAASRPEVLMEAPPEESAEQKPSWEEGHTLSCPENEAAVRILSRLSQREREFLELRYGLELTDGEIARIYGTSRDAIRMRYERLLAKCRRM